ncbi:hypothetical protein RDI58_007448 [Solanum bulbocastanum]|uniref:Uncharacterized protein n=1 Tax=Solanum bulbocastanum TaxID=147425 RepID=A0AAN8TV19_SOLBU
MNSGLRRWEAKAKRKLAKPKRNNWLLAQNSLGKPMRSLDDDGVWRFYLELLQFLPALPNVDILLEEFPDDEY